MIDPIKCFIVEINKKFEGEWYRQSATCNTLDDVFDFISKKNVNRFTLTVVRKKDAEEQGVLF